MARFSLLCSVLTFLGLTASTAFAGAARLDCGIVEADVIEVDGLLDDWEGKAWTAGKVALRCDHDERWLYLAVHAKSGRPRPVTIQLGEEILKVVPGKKGSSAKIVGALATEAKAHTALARPGWVVEIQLPYAKWREAYAVPFEVRGPASARLQLTFEDKHSTYRRGLGILGLDPSKLRLDTLANLDGEPGLERVVAGETTVASFGKGFAYFKLPAPRPRDIHALRVVDLGGDGKASVVVCHVERGSGGLREVLAVYNQTSRGFTRTFAQEVAKQIGERRLASSWKLVPRKRKGGHELVIEAQPTEDFTEETWRESPASDMQPILLPWSETTRQTWRFENDQVFGG